VNPFSLSLTPARVAEAAQTLSTEERKEEEQ
jgi:hypothetical protein